MHEVAGPLRSVLEIRANLPGTADNVHKLYPEFNKVVGSSVHQSLHHERTIHT